MGAPEKKKNYFLFIYWRTTFFSVQYLSNGFSVRQFFLDILHVCNYEIVTCGCLHTIILIFWWIIITGTGNCVLHSAHNHVQCSPSIRRTQFHCCEKYRDPCESESTCNTQHIFWRLWRGTISMLLITFLTKDFLKT